MLSLLYIHLNTISQTQHERKTLLTHHILIHSHWRQCCCMALLLYTTRSGPL